MKNKSDGWNCVSCNEKFGVEHLLREHVKEHHPEYYLHHYLTKRDAEKVKHVKCNWCEKPSIARIRLYPNYDKLNLEDVIGSCTDHLPELKKLINSTN